MVSNSGSNVSDYLNLELEGVLGSSQSDIARNRVVPSGLEASEVKGSGHMGTCSLALPEGSGHMGLGVLSPVKAREEYCSESLETSQLVKKITVTAYMGKQE